MATKQPAVVLAQGLYDSVHGKVAHGLVRGSDRFAVVAVVDQELAGQDAGAVLDGQHRGIPIVATLQESLRVGEKPAYCLVGVATHGGRFTDALLVELREAARLHLHLVNGLHDFLSDDPVLSQQASQHSLQLIDLRRPKATQEMQFWSGEIRQLSTPRIAVLGTDCALGKRTTARYLVQACHAGGLAAQMIYTGQTGWMQGAEYGFVLDATLNDSVAGELEQALLCCAREAQPDVMIIEGQSSLRNPCGPCGSELLVAGGARGVILQHAPERRFFEGYEEVGCQIPSLSEELELIQLYGAEVLAVTLNGSPENMAHLIATVSKQVTCPVLDPLKQMTELVGTVQSFVQREDRQ